MEIDTEGMNIVDITDIFWDVVNKIVILDYDDLMETSSFIQLADYINHDYTYILNLREIGLTTYPKDLNDMFYDTIRYYKDKAPNSNNCILLENALKKIESYLQIESEISDILINTSFFK